MSPTTSLPAGFEALEPFVADWALRGMARRAERRETSTDAERVAFFAAARDLAGPALARLDEKPLADLDDKERRLMDLMLGFAHVALAVEMQGDDEAKHACAARRLRITQATADVGP